MMNCVNNVNKNCHNERKIHKRLPAFPPENYIMYENVFIMIAPSRTSSGGLFRVKDVDYQFPS